MTNTDMNEYLLQAITAYILGFYAIATGVRFILSPDKIQPISYKIGIAIVRFFQGKSVAEQQEKNLFVPSRIRRHGYLRIAIGFLFLIGGILIVVVLFTINHT